MFIETVNWGWPQWAWLILVFTGLIIHATKHGEECVETSGERKGKPKRYNTVVRFCAVLLSLFILISGGFFK